MNQGNRLRSLEIDPHRNGQFIFDNNARKCNGGIQCLFDKTARIPIASKDRIMNKINILLALEDKSLPHETTIRKNDTIAKQI